MAPEIPEAAGPLAGMRVLEIGDERVEFCGRLLVGGGADVIKVEPLSGSPTRSYGPFLAGRDRDIEASLYFWHYNQGKRSLALDLESPDGRASFRRLAANADIVLDGMGATALEDLELGYSDLTGDNTGLVWCSITDFGADGPWRDYRADDLVHLALGGQMMVCGYTPGGDYDPATPSSSYDTPPIAPQMWQSYQTTAINAATAVYGALFEREITGLGQRVDVSIHNAMAACTEFAVPYWIYTGQRVWRQTASHAMPQIGNTHQTVAADGKLVFAMGSIGLFGDEWSRLVEMLDTVELGGELRDPQFAEREYRARPEVATRVLELVRTFVAILPAEEAVRRAQDAGLAWAVVRWPEDNLDDEHWAIRETLQPVEHEELGSAPAVDMGRPFLSNEMPWHVGRRAPMLGEHTRTVLAEVAGFTAAEIDDLERQRIASQRAVSVITSETHSRT